MTKKISVQENTERAFLMEKMYHLDKRTNGLFIGLGQELETNGLLNGLGKELETYLKWKRLLKNE